MKQDFEADVEAALKVLKEGGILLYPTDTVWGLGCDATNAEAVDKIMALKQRPPHKSFVTLLADEREFVHYVGSLDLAVFDYVKEAPKPTTVIYENAIGLADNVLADNGSIAIRLCNEPFCQTLIRRFKKPIVSTSANLSGHPSPALFAEVEAPIVNGVDYVVKYRQDDTHRSEPSTIIKWTNGKIEVVRP